jgi:hypothetical protein
MYVEIVGNAASSQMGITTLIRLVQNVVIVDWVSIVQATMTVVQVKSAIARIIDASNGS